MGNPGRQKVVLAKRYPATLHFRAGCAIVNIIEFYFYIGVIHVGADKTKISASKPTRITGVIEVVSLDLPESICLPAFAGLIVDYKSNINQIAVSSKAETFCYLNALVAAHHQIHSQGIIRF